MASKCPDAMLLSAYIDGELSQKRWLQVALHLEHCSRCREELGGLQRVKTIVAGLPQLTAPNIRTYTSPPKRSTDKLLLWCLAAASMVLLVIGLNFRHPQVREVSGEYLRIHRQYEQQIAQNSQRMGEVLEGGK